MEEEATNAGAKLDQLEMEIRRFEDKIKQVQAECVKQSNEIEQLGQNIRMNGQDASRYRRSILCVQVPSLIEENDMTSRIDDLAN